MKVTYNWLKDYLNIRMPPGKLVEALTMAGLEVTSLKRLEDDWVLEIEATSNRPDWLSVAGVAREVAAITKSKLKIETNRAIEQATPRTKIKNQKLRIKIVDRAGCRQYMGTVICDVKIAPSPRWMQKRLRAIGLRPVNNVVDITNYVLYETGQPLHAFDLGKLSSPAKIIVRRARNKEKITTLDRTARVLDENILVIADNSRPIAVAGVIGGADSEVDSNTKNILLESAEFDPVTVRKGARRLGILTDSSYRFERGVDPCGIERAAHRATELILQLAAGNLDTSHLEKERRKKQDRKIPLSIEAIERILGIKVGLNKARQILSVLGFGIKKTKTRNSRKLIVSIPSFRQDVLVQEDLAEEIARIYGYDKIPSGKEPSGLPYILPRIIDAKSLCCLEGKSPDNKLIKTVKNTLCTLGFSEVINYSLSPQEVFDKPKSRLLKIENPLSREQGVLRADLFPGLLGNVSYNLNRKNDQLKIFELGKIFEQDKGVAVESFALGLAVCGRLRLDWQREDKTNMTFFDLKGCIEKMLLRLVGRKEIEFIEQRPPFPRLPLPSWSALFDINIKGEQVGVIGEASSDRLANYSIKKKRIFLAQISVDGLSKYFKPDKKFVPYSTYPSIRRDISLLLGEDTPYEKVRSIISSLGGKMIAGIKLLGPLYTGEQVPEHFKNLLLSVEYGSFKRTLTDEEVDVIHRKILDNLVDKLGVKIR